MVRCSLLSIRVCFIPVLCLLHVYRFVLSCVLLKNLCCAVLHSVCEQVMGDEARELAAAAAEAAAGGDAAAASGASGEAAAAAADANKSGPSPQHAAADQAGEV